MKCVIFDLDGTIANCDHRIGYLKVAPKNWDAFWAGTRLDDGYDHILEIANMYNNNNIPIIIVTARSGKSRDCTEWWLNNVAKIKYDSLHMRSQQDYRPDTEVKKEILYKLRDMGYDPYIAYEDRDSVVEMWRKEGVTCVQVKEGDY